MAANPSQRTDKKSAFILSAYPAGLGVIRALGKQGISLTVGTYDPQEIGRKSKYIHRLERLPDVEFQEQSYIEALLSERVGVAGRALIPTADQTLSAISRHKEILQEKYQVGCPDWRITEKFLDKKYTCILAEKAGVRPQNISSP